MKTIFLHGLGQTARDWERTVSLSSSSETECPELFSLSDRGITYSQILAGLEERYASVTEPFRICGLSLGAILALDYALRNHRKVASLVLIGVQYKIPAPLIGFQNLLFRFMPDRALKGTGLSKGDMIKLAHSMRSLDFSKRLDELECPVAVICGSKDTANLKAAKSLDKILPQAKLYLIPGVGHEVNKCAPESIAAILDMQQ